MTESSVGPVGRVLRTVLGAVLIIFALPFYLFPGVRVTLFGVGYFSNLPSIALALSGTIGFLILYVFIHYIVSKYLPKINRWLGAILANVPPILVFIFSGGAERIAVLTYGGLSLLLAGWRSDPGCEVMTPANIILRKRTSLACIIFSPIDWAERKLRKANTS